jgi:hypothetical protein
MSSNRGRRPNVLMGWRRFTSAGVTAPGYNLHLGRTLCALLPETRFKAGVRRPKDWRSQELYYDAPFSTCATGRALEVAPQ